MNCFNQIIMQDKIDQKVNITLRFTPIKPLTKSFSKKLKFNEFEQWLMSKFKLRDQDKKKGLLKSMEDRDKTNNISSGTIDIDLNDFLEKLFDEEKNDTSIQFCQFIPSNELVFSNESIGDGSFGVVTKCNYLNAKDKNIKYAFKSFKEDQQKSFETFSKEVSAYSKLNHPAIPKFVGVSYDSEKKHGILMEYITGQDMLKCINSIEENDKLEIIYQLADVMSYLHSNDCIHRDLKPNNIILRNKEKSSSKPQLFLIDYGLSKMDDDNEKMNTVRSIVTDNSNVYKFLWGENLYAYKSFDIWSMGCIIYFLYTKKHPCNLRDNELDALVRSNKNFFKKDEFKDEFIYEIIKDCCDLDHEKRKTAQEIRDMVFKNMHCQTKGKLIFNV